MRSGTDGRGIQGGMPLWSQGVGYSAAREGEAARGSERWKGEVSSPSRLGGREEVRAVVSKRGVDDGNQKGGGSLQPAKENQFNYI